MFRRVTSIILLSATASVSLLPAQVRTESAPVDDYVLRITQMWGRESALVMRVRSLSRPMTSSCACGAATD
jgi:hypothetical protein